MDNNSLDNIVFSCDIAGSSIPLAHFWEHTVGSCHATMALRADYQQQLAQCRRDLGFMHVRFHGLLSDDMCTLIDQDNKPVYSFFNTDQICDFLISIGMKPFMELSFMPSMLSSGGDIVFHYKGNITPPKSYADWATLISKLVGHWVERYGLDEVCQWFFEVWNEPNLDAFWKGSQAEYFKLYQYTAEAIKKIDPKLKVGGPATANNEWISEFTEFIEKNNVPNDFISTHHYPTDSFGQPGDDTVAQLAASRRSALRDEAAKVKEQAKGKPVYYTEWCTSSNPFDDMHDQPYAAAFIVKTVLEANGLVQGYSYWTFSDIFEENYLSSVPFHGGFGLMNIYGVPKPAYRAFELLHHLGNELLTIKGTHATVDIWVVRKQGAIAIMITNWALPRHNIKTESVTLNLENISDVKTAWIERIDDNNANARAEWGKQGMPDSLSPNLVKELMNVSMLKKQPVPMTSYENKITMTLTMPPQSVACITLERK